MTGPDTEEGFSPPPYPYDRLAEAARTAAAHPGGAIDLSVGTPCDPPPSAVVEALGTSGTERGYPASIGSAPLRGAAVAWMRRRFGVSLDPAQVAACVGTKEFVATRGVVPAACAPPVVTPSWPRPSPTRPTPWGRAWPGAGWSRSPPAATVAPTSRPSRTRTPGEPCACG